MKVLEDVVRIFGFVALALLILGVIRNAQGTFTVLNGFANLFNTGYQAEIQGAGSQAREGPPAGGWRGTGK